MEKDKEIYLLKEENLKLKSLVDIITYDLDNLKKNLLNGIKNKKR
jgi:hypothetical protein